MPPKRSRASRGQQRQEDDEEQVQAEEANVAATIPNAAQHTQPVAGHVVVFPHIPYGAQNAFMYKLIHALQNKKNALLEAPTGAGKTLCLLCGALAWQARLKKEMVKTTLASMGAGSGKSDAVSDRPADTIMDVDGIPNESDMLHREADSGSPDDPTAGAEGAERVKVPQIYYATRTHSQIDQVVKELKRTAYKPSMAILAARRFYCINGAVIKSGKIDEECEELNREEFGCRFHRQKGVKMTGLQVHDIEDLVTQGKKQKLCPYYASREMMTTAELVFCPYNYLVDPSIREALGLNLSNAVVIFDEAHNIEDMAREAGSVDVQLSVLFDVHQALMRAKTFASKPEPYEVLFRCVEDLMCWLKDMSESQLMKATDNFGREQCKQAVFLAPQQIFQQLEAARLSAEQLRLLQKAYKSAREYENSKDATFANSGEAAEQAVPQDMKTAGAGAAALGVLSQLLTVLQLLYGARGSAQPAADIEAEEPQEGAADVLPSAAAGGLAGDSTVVQLGDNGAAYRMVVTSVTQTARPSAQRRGKRNTQQRAIEAGEDPTQGSHTVTLGLWCMTPSVAFQSLASCCHSLILTSGTLSPLTSFASELGTAFDVKLEGKHVVDMSKQVWAAVLASGPGGCDIRTTFSNKDDTRMQDDMGQAILQLAETVPAGMLVFFPSYTTMDQLVRHWKTNGLWEQLSSVKDCVVEPREGGAAFEKAMSHHKATVARGRGSLLMAVCRGKVSEGIDFKDDQARAVVIVGIPYPAARDAKVMLKKGYNDKQHTAPGMHAQAGASSSNSTAQVLTGEQWYELQAFRALNQAVGRCIRHKYDYGAVILLDARFKESRYTSKLPAWVRGSVQVAPNFSTAKDSLQAFFRTLQANPPAAAAVASALQSDPAPVETATVARGGGEGIGAGAGAGATAGGAVLQGVCGSGCRQQDQCQQARFDLDPASNICTLTKQHAAAAGSAQEYAMCAANSVATDASGACVPPQALYPQPQGQGQQVPAASDGVQWGGGLNHGQAAGHREGCSSAWGAAGPQQQQQQGQGAQQVANSAWDMAWSQHVPSSRHGSTAAWQQTHQANSHWTLPAHGNSGCSAAPAQQQPQQRHMGIQHVPGQNQPPSNQHVGTQHTTWQAYHPSDRPQHSSWYPQSWSAGAGTDKLLQQHAAAERHQHAAADRHQQQPYARTAPAGVQLPSTPMPHQLTQHNPSAPAATMLQQHPHTSSVAPGSVAKRSPCHASPIMTPMAGHSPLAVTPMTGGGFMPSAKSTPATVSTAAAAAHTTAAAAEGAICMAASLAPVATPVRGQQPVQLQQPALSSMQAQQHTQQAAGDAASVEDTAWLNAQVASAAPSATGSWQRFAQLGNGMRQSDAIPAALPAAIPGAWQQWQQPATQAAYPGTHGLAQHHLPAHQMPLPHTPSVGQAWAAAHHGQNAQQQHCHTPPSSTNRATNSQQQQQQQNTHPQQRQQQHMHIPQAVCHAAHGVTWQQQQHTAPGTTAAGNYRNQCDLIQVQQPVAQQHDQRHAWAGQAMQQQGWQQQQQQNHHHHQHHQQLQQHVQWHAPQPMHSDSKKQQSNNGNAQLPSYSGLHHAGHQSGARGMAAGQHGTWQGSGIAGTAHNGAAAACAAHIGGAAAASARPAHTAAAPVATAGGASYHSVYTLEHVGNQTMQPALSDSTNTSLQLSAGNQRMPPPSSTYKQGWQVSSVGAGIQQASAGQKRAASPSATSSPANKIGSAERLLLRHAELRE